MGRRKAATLEPARTLRLPAYVENVVPLRDGRLVASTHLGADIVDGDDLEPLPATPLRWPDQPSREPAVVWELDGDALRCRPQSPAVHAFVIGPGVEPRLFTTESEGSAKLGAALPGRPWEALCPASDAILRLDVRTGDRFRRDLPSLVGIARLGDRLLAWTQKEVVAFDLELSEVARRAYDFIHGVAAVGEWGVVLGTREAGIVNEELEEFDRLAHHGPGPFVADSARGWLHVGNAHSGYVSTLDIAGGKVRWEATTVGRGPGRLLVTGDLLVSFAALSAGRGRRASENTAHGTILNASTGGHVALVSAPGDVTQAIAVGRAGVACVWWPYGDDVHAHRAAVWTDPRTNQDGVELVAHDGRFRGLCLDADGALVSWGADGTLARWELGA